MKRWLGNLLALSGSALLMAAFFEIACRTVLDTGMQYHLEMWKYAVSLKRISSNPEIGHEHTPGTQARLMGADVSINKLGLRNEEVGSEKPESTTRILMLGDSITFGWGVAQDETMSAQLALALNAIADGQDEKPVEVINTGVGNYNTAMEVAYFMERGAALKPDVVVLNYFINDAEPTPIYRDVPWYARHSYAYAVLGGAWDGFKRRLSGNAQDWRAYYAGLYVEGAPGWQKAQNQIAALAAFCRQQGIRLIMVNIPELRELQPYAFPEVETKVQAVAEAHGIEYVDLLSSVQGEDPSALWVTVPDPHPNARAQRLMAARLAGYLAERRTPAAGSESP
jgi:lysophospholipase L1-like esterase